MRSGADSIFVAGGTGYIGRPLIENLVARGFSVDALVREGSAKRAWELALSNGWRRRTDVPEMLRHSPLIVLSVGDAPSSDQPAP